MNLLMNILIILTFLQPLQYGIPSMIQLSCQRRTLYPLLHIKHPEGIQPFITMKETVYRIPAFSVCS